ncbi:MAG: type II toxin-antitoxin system RelE/ParE family toxin [Bacteroidota bacterium]|nr:type II toxin-antitoxin system RelE/ParE family toxin [Bacteroidota bacterium]MDP3434175.1 type II toxin-antitoxin system RelE/ParE family toxin [Bacteroidota bacterium]
MEIRIEWSELSEKQLKDIFDYYSLEVNARIARKIINRIIDRVLILGNNPLAGQLEELLSDYPEDFRYLIEGNYKIIYWKNENLITIASVIDCRQNPRKIKEIEP